ncbi:MAG: FAD-dependent oxidoreductase, partial [Proteobacteria bacterium]|nr:FAD-dependent oxidoreductase [Pseudomonadota bacterium]
DFVTMARDYKFMCSHPGQEYILEDIQKNGINRVVVASCSPRMHEPTFRKTCENAGINPHYFQMANIREQVAWVTLDSGEATEKAKDLVAAAVGRVAHHQPLISREVEVKKSVLVLGGGIAGMQAAISSANAGYEVFLVEREASIGGHMAKFDKTFPTLDCAACIMTPKMVEVGQHKGINLFSYSEVISIEGFVGNFKARILKKPRYILEDKCTGCGLCTEVCPVDRDNVFDESLSLRKAVFRSFPQAVPITFCIEKKDRAPCVQACPAGINVQGYIQLIKKGRFQEACNMIREKLPLPGVLGRVCPHPCETACRRGLVDEPIAICDLKRFAADHSDLKKYPLPMIAEKQEKVAVIGSGPAGLTVAYDLRNQGYQVTIFEALPVLGGMLRVGIPAYRLPREILDKEIQNILDSGITVQTETRFGKDLHMTDLQDRGFSAVFMGVGAHEAMKMGIQGEDTRGVVDAITYLRTINLGEKPYSGKQIAVIGGGNVAIDAARTARRMGSDSVTLVYRRTEKEMPAYADEIHEAKEEGVVLSVLSAPVKVLEKEGRVAGLECIKTRLGLPDGSGRRRPEPLEGSEFVIPCDMIIPAIGQVTDTTWHSNVPGLELTARKTLKTNSEGQSTTMPFVFSGGDAVRGPATVIEAVADGHRAAGKIHQWLSGIEKKVGTPASSEPEDTPGENWTDIPLNEKHLKREVKSFVLPEKRVADFGETTPGLSEEQAIREAERCLNCGACSECMACVEACEAKAIDHSMKPETMEVHVGAVIVATGFKAFDPTPMVQYGYGLYPEVYTSLEFERLNNATGPTSGQILKKDGTPPKKVAIIHCVGSRDKNHREYCSRVCCMYSMKFAHLVREKTGAEVWEFYIDVRSPGKLYEEFYNRVQEEEVHMIRGRVAEVTDIVENPGKPEDQGRLTVVAENTLSRKTLRIPVDMVILSVGLEPALGALDVGRMVGVSSDKNGWFTELHAKLAPVSTPSKGIFLAGCCQGPKDIPDTVAQAMAASGEAVALLSKGTVTTLTEISCIDPDLCTGCKTCMASCSYKAISFDEGSQVAVVNEALCQGCGSCSAACPSSAAGVRHFTDKQVMDELEAILL